MATTTGIGVSQTIAIDLAKPGIPKMVYAMQGEGYTRTVSLKIFDGGVQWTPPNGAVYEVSYCKPDGKGGTYSSYTTDSSKPAVTVSDGRLNVVLIPQMLQVAGRVRVEVHMQHAAIMAYAERLSTFTFYIMVQASAESGIASEDYWNAAQTDKVVLLNAAIGATANVVTTHNVSEFVSTPHVRDAVVGSDGYTGKVTAASGTSVTIVSTGALWADLSGTGNAVPLPTYNMPEVGSVVQVKELDASGNPKSWRYSKMASVCFTNEADIPTTPGTAVQLVGLAWYPDDPKLGELAVGKNGYTGEVTAVDDENGPTVTATGNRIFTFAASDITYSGTVDGQAVANVKVALDALAAREQALVVRFTDQSSGTITADKTIAEILAAHSSGKPVAGVHGNSDYLLAAVDSRTAYFALWTGVDTYMLEGIVGADADSADSWTLTNMPIKGTKVVLKGQIDGEEFGDVAGALAILNRRGADHVAYSGNVPNSANVKAALDALAIGKPLDMTADYVASGAESVGQWIAMAATGSTTEYRVPCGTFLLRAVDGIYGMTIVTIFEEPDGNWRGAIDIKFTCDCDWEIRFWQGAAVGQTPDVAATFQVNNSGDISLNGANNLENLVPVGNELQKGKFLMCNASGGAEWASLPTYDGGVS